MNYELKELSPEEAKQITDELQAILAKYDCEMGVTSSINIMKRQELAQPAQEPTLSPIQDVKTNGDEDTTQDNPETTPA